MADQYSARERAAAEAMAALRFGPGSIHFEARHWLPYARVALRAADGVEEKDGD